MNSCLSAQKLQPVADAINLRPAWEIGHNQLLIKTWSTSNGLLAGSKSAST